MGRYSIYTEGKLYSGDLDFSATGEATAYANLSMHNGVLHSDSPFQVVLMNYAPELEVPHRITMMAPAHYTHVEFDPDSFRRVSAPGNLHQHNTFELVYVLSGTLYQRIESERHVYPEGSLLLLNRSVRHTEEFDIAFRTVSLSLSADYFRELLGEENRMMGAKNLWGDNTDLHDFLVSELSGTGNEYKKYLDFIPIENTGGGAKTVTELFDRMIRILMFPAPGDAFFFRGYICRLLSLLSNRELYTTRPIALGTPSESRIFAQINNLLEQNRGGITREFLSEQLHYSGNYLNRIVQTFTGMTITRYALYYGLKEAARELLETDRTITEIAGDLGFTNRTYFYTEFKKQYGETPRAYRMNHVGKGEMRQK